MSIPFNPAEAAVATDIADKAFQNGIEQTIDLVHAAFGPGAKSTIIAAAVGMKRGVYQSAGAAVVGTISAWEASEGDEDKIPLILETIRTSFKEAVDDGIKDSMEALTRIMAEEKGEDP